MSFVLNTHTGTIERGWKDSQASQSNYILSVIIGILLVAVGALMYNPASPSAKEEKIVSKGA